MRALVFAVMLAACAGTALAQDAPPPAARPLDPLSPFTPLIGCWQGAFENTPDIRDERCFEVMFGAHYVRDEHRVEPTPYAGLTIYHFNPADHTLGFSYYASDGGMSRGGVHAEPGALVFAPHTYVGADGRAQRLRSTWRFEGRDRFVAESERDEAGVWVAFMRITYTRVPEPE